MASVINFRMQQNLTANAWEQISFNGNGMKLIDLKCEIISKKNMSTTDFDLRVIDEDGKGRRKKSALQFI